MKLTLPICRLNVFYGQYIQHCEPGRCLIYSEKYRWGWGRGRGQGNDLIALDYQNLTSNMFPY